MAKTIVRDIGVKVSFDITQANQNITQLNKQISAIGRESKSLQESLKIKWDPATYNRAMELAQEKTRLTVEKVKELQSVLKEYDARGVEKTSAEYEDLSRQITMAETKAKSAYAEIAKLQTIKIENLTKQFDEVEKKLTGMGKALMPFSLAAAGGMTLATKAAIDMESVMAGVQKTTEASDEELAAMKDQLIDMSKKIPVAATELGKIAENAGQLGIAKENVLGFTRVMADVGATTDMSGDAAATTFAKLANITGMAQGDFDRLGSAVMSVGNSLATTESDLSDMALRLAAAGKQAKMTEADIVGIAGALASVGLESQAGGTAFSKVINAMNVSVETGNARLKDFAEVAGMSGAEFAKAFRADAADALVSFISGLGDVEGHGKSTILMLQEMGLTEVHLRDALTRAANSSDMFRDSIALGNKAWDENTALTEKASIRYATTAAQIETAKNAVTALGVELGDHIAPAIVKMATGVSDFVGWLAKLDKATNGLVSRFGIFLAALAPSLTIMGKMSGAIGSMVKAYQTLKITLEAKKIADNGATVSQIALNGAMAANPAGALSAAIGVVVAVVGSLVTAYALAGSKTDEYNKKLKETVEAQKEAAKSAEDKRDSSVAELAVIEGLLPKIEELNSKTNKTAGEQATLNGMVQMANEVYPELIGKIDSATGSYDINTASIQENIEALKKQYAVQANQDILAESYKAIGQLEIDRVKTVKALEKAEAELVIVEDQLSKATQTTTDEHEKYIIMDAFASSIADARDQVNAYEGVLAETDSQIKAYTEETDILTDALIKQGEAVEETKGEVSDLAVEARLVWESIEDVTESEGKLVKSTTELNTSMHSLSDAFAEQEKNGRLSLDTTLKLIEAGYATAISIDAESGAVRLNRDAYIELVKAKIEEQIQTAKQTRETVIDNLRKESFAVFDVTNAYYALAVAKIKSSQSDLASVDTTIAALEAAKANIGKVTSGTYSSSPETKKAAKTKTEKDPLVEQYKEQRKAIEYERDMAGKDDVEAQAAYYTKLRELQGKYLKENSEEWRAVNVEIHKEEEKLREEAAKSQTNDYKTARAEAEYERDMDTISRGEYFERLKALQTEYLIEGSDEWRKVNLELYGWQKEQEENWVKLYEETLKKIDEAEKQRTESAKKYADERYQSRLDEIDRELKLEKERLQAIIDNIDIELAQRKRLDEQEGYDKRIERVQYLLTYERDSDNLVNLQKELISLEKERADWKYQNQKEDEKQAARNAMEAADIIAENKRNKASSERDSEERSYYTQLTEQQRNQEALQAASRVSAAAAAATYNSSASTVNADNRTFSAPITVTSAMSAASVSMIAAKTFQKIIEGV